MPVIPATPEVEVEESSPRSTWGEKRTPYLKSERMMRRKEVR
jgi:hypothetical protein